MPDNPGQVPVPLKREREQTVKLLIDHYAADNLTVEEFESRLDSAYTATSREALDALLTGLPDLRPDDDSTAVAHPPIATVPADQVRNFNVQVAIMGGSDRRGAWTPARKLYTLALMGGAGLDFREARMPPGETEVNVLAMMGGVEIIVPPGLAVETHGFGFMGGFEALDQAGDSREPDAPRLVIRGMAVMGGVDVTVRLPGETAKEARRRRRLERKERRQLKRGSDE